VAEFSDPAADLRRRIEAAKTQADPALRDQALSGLEAEVRGEMEGSPSDELNDLLGLVRTYRGDARLQLEGATNG
jgi:hypothetical protein